jgi:hypothetical protein
MITSSSWPSRSPLFGGAAVWFVGLPVPVGHQDLLYLVGQQFGSLDYQFQLCIAISSRMWAREGMPNEASTTY